MESIAAAASATNFVLFGTIVPRRGHYAPGGRGDTKIFELTYRSDQYITPVAAAYYEVYVKFPNSKMLGSITTLL